MVGFYWYTRLRGYFYVPEGSYGLNLDELADLGLT